MAETKTIQELVREAEQADKFGVTTASEFVSFSMRKEINTTEAYINSKFTSGDTDSLGRPKPFKNICIPARNIWYRATDIDRKNIIIRADNDKSVIPAMLATIKFQDWMKRNGFGQFLNDWGLSLATHGSSVLKFIEKDGELHCQVMDWNNIIVDAVDFDNNLVIEKLWMTPAQLRKNKSYDKELVEDLIENASQTRKTMEGQQKDNKTGYIPIYEVHGELPLSLLTGKEKDEETYVQQMHVITFLEKKENAEEWNEYALYQGRESKSPYMITHLIKKDGITYTGGAVKNLFEAQWMVNTDEKRINDNLELASKQLFQTSDDAFVGKNVLTTIETGDILNHAPNQPLTQLNNQPNIVPMQSSQQSWQSIAAQINGISEAMMGINPPSGSAWRQTQALLQESHSLFELMTENKGLYIEEMLRTYILPFFRKQLDNDEAISSVLSDLEIKQIDAKYLPSEVTRRMNERKKKTILSGALFDPTTEGQDTAAIEAEIKGSLQGNQRFIKPSEVKGSTWKELFKDLEWNVEVDVTGENKDTQGALATLTTVLQTLASNPAILQDPNVSLVFRKILNMTGTISPLELSAPQPMAQPMPQMAQQA